MYNDNGIICTVQWALQRNLLCTSNVITGYKRGFNFMVWNCGLRLVVIKFCFFRICAFDSIVYDISICFVLKLFGHLNKITKNDQKSIDHSPKLWFASTCVQYRFMFVQPTKKNQFSEHRLFFELISLYSIFICLYIYGEKINQKELNGHLHISHRNIVDYIKFLYSCRRFYTSIISTMLNRNLK